MNKSFASKAERLALADDVADIRFEHHRDVVVVDRGRDDDVIGFEKLVHQFVRQT